MESSINSIIQAYDTIISGIDKQAIVNVDRAYGGIIRAEKGKMVESITKQLVGIAWIDVLKQDKNRLVFSNSKSPLKVNLQRAEILFTFSCRLFGHS